MVDEFLFHAMVQAEYTCGMLKWKCFKRDFNLKKKNKPKYKVRDTLGRARIFWSFITRKVYERKSKPKEIICGRHVVEW